MQKDIIVGGIILLIVLWAFIEHKLLVTTKYTICSTRLPKQLDRTNFVVLADLHNNNFGKRNTRLINQINKLSPDFILVAGDMINKKAPSYPSHASILLEQLVKSYPIYYAYGNHELRMEQYLEMTSDHKISSDVNTKHITYLHSTWVEFKKHLSDAGVIFLNNESIIVNKNNCKLQITGVSIEQKYFDRNKKLKMEDGYLEELVKAKANGEYQILIAHHPFYFKNYAKWGADVILSGHVHGGMVRLPGVGGILSPQAKFFPKYQAGTYTEDGKYMVVSRGLGSHSIMPRLFNIPELVSVNLKIKSNH
jgi:predicted MPP superfamily phosphohydrolase